QDPLGLRGIAMRGGGRIDATAGLHCWLGCETPAGSQRQTVPVKLLIALPAQTFVKLLRRIIVDRRLKGQAVAWRAPRQPMSALHQGASHPKLARLSNHVEI